MEKEKIVKALEICGIIFGFPLFALSLIFSSASDAWVHGLAGIWFISLSLYSAKFRKLKEELKG